MSINKDTSNGINIARPVSCFLVILLHVAGIGFYEGGDNWLGANIIDSFTRVCVPVFIMITGALLIKDEPVKPFSRIKRVIACLIFWSVFYLAVDGKFTGDIFSIAYGIIEAPAKYHLWYLYVCISFYLILPVFSRFYVNTKDRYPLIIVLLWVIFSSVTFIDKVYATQLNSILVKYQLSNFISLAGYLLLGKILADYCSGKKSVVMIWCALFSYISLSLITASLTLKWSRIIGGPDALFYSNLSPVVIFSSASFFCLILLVGNMIYKFDAFWKFLSKYTLGIYCIHIFILEITIKYVVSGGKLGLNYFGMIALAAFVFLTSLALIFLMHKIKPLRYVI